MKKVRVEIEYESTEDLFNKIISENYPNLEKVNIQAKEAFRSTQKTQPARNPSTTAPSRY